MTRFGRILLGLLLLAAIAFAAVLRLGPGSAPAPASAPTTVASTGPLIIPVAGVRPEQLVDTFGDARGGDARGGGARAHGALDIMAPRGTPVLAAQGGTVEKIFESRLGGHTVYIRSPDRGTVTYYAHLDAYAPDLKEGSYVEQGHEIGAVGFTGDASAEGPHLHFEVKRMAAGEKWYQGSAINPYHALKAGWSGEGPPR